MEEAGADDNEPPGELVRWVFKASLKDGGRSGDVWGVCRAEDGLALRAESSQALIKLSYTVSSCLS